MNLEEKLFREEIVLASISRRVLAFLLDKFLISFIFTFIYWDAFVEIGESYVQIVNFFNQIIWQFLLLSYAYEVLFTNLYGATLGKIVCKIKVVSISLLDHPNFFYSCIRSMIKILGESFFYVPFCLVFFTPFKQALHDVLGKTIVVNYA